MITPPTELSMYERIGGAPTVRRVVDRMYAWIFHDDILYLRYFSHVDKSTLKAHMVKLLSQILGGPSQYAGRELADAHSGLRDSTGRPVTVTMEHYRRVGDYVMAALLVEHPPEDIISAVESVLRDTAAVVVQTPKVEPRRPDLPVPVWGSTPR